MPTTWISVRSRGAPSPRKRASIASSTASGTPWPPPDPLTSTVRVRTARAARRRRRVMNFMVRASLAACPDGRAIDTHCCAVTGYICDGAGIFVNRGRRATDRSGKARLNTMARSGLDSVKVGRQLPFRQDRRRDRRGAVRRHHRRFQRHPHQRPVHEGALQSRRAHRAWRAAGRLHVDRLDHQHRAHHPPGRADGFPGVGRL